MKRNGTAATSFDFSTSDGLSQLHDPTKTVTEFNALNTLPNTNTYT